MPDEPAGISIVITVRNEGHNLGELFKSLEHQQGPFEVIIVDSESTDNTSDVISSFKEALGIKHIIKKSSRGEGRNIGAQNASYRYLVFTDGDVTVNPEFLKAYAEKFRSGFNLIAGNVIPEGVHKFKLDRVKLTCKGFEITHPSANLGYSSELFQSLKGFDPTFVTAEDIDLNLRAVTSGAKFAVCQECVVYNKTRDNYSQFAKQAFWNGYGRRQLKRKNLKIWRTIEKGEKIGNGPLFPHMVRLGFGALGYLYSFLKNEML